jgi:hypothetical protein
MRLEYLDNIDLARPNEGIIRIFDFDSSEACLFRDTVSTLSNGSASTVDLGAFPFVKSVRSCRLLLKVGAKDQGAILLSGNTYECVLTREAWEDVRSLVEPFCRSDDQSKYQWLYDLNTGIELLFSPSGSW